MQWLVEDWRGAWRWLSVNLSVLLIAWASLDPKTQADIVAGWVPPEKVPMVLGVLILAGRLVKQPRRRKPASGSDGNTTPQH